MDSYIIHVYACVYVHLYDYLYYVRTMMLNIAPLFNASLPFRFSSFSSPSNVLPPKAISPILSSKFAFSSSFYPNCSPVFLFFLFPSPSCWRWKSLFLFPAFFIECNEDDYALLLQNWCIGQHVVVWAEESCRHGVSGDTNTLPILDFESQSLVVPNK